MTKLAQPTKLSALRREFNSAMRRFEEIMSEKKTVLVRDAALKRFEFTFDAAWKMLRAHLAEEKGVICRSPKGCFREAFHQEVIPFDEDWIKMTDWRNKIVHEYGEQYADSLYKILPEILILLKKLEIPMQDEKHRKSRLET